MREEQPLNDAAERRRYASARGEYGPPEVVDSLATQLISSLHGEVVDVGEVFARGWSAEYRFHHLFLSIEGVESTLKLQRTLENRLREKMVLHFLQDCAYCKHALST